MSVQSQNHVCARRLSRYTATDAKAMKRRSIQYEPKLEAAGIPTSWLLEQIVRVRNHALIGVVEVRALVHDENDTANDSVKPSHSYRP